nr:FRG domain-containing protein [Tropicibacter sp. R15_0]
MPERHIDNWGEFQNFAKKSVGKGFAFRGQSKSWPLATTFHRKGRTNLDRYWSSDIPRLQRATSSSLTHVFDLMKQFELNAFLNLAQHHGYPTPLLDWTFSPYVAAYFAYSRCDEAQSEPVRIFYIDYEEYTRIIPQIHTLASVTPHFSFLEAPSIANDRAIPQQGLLGLSNVADIERFVRNHEEKNEKSFLFAIDLPASEKTQVLAELGLMGITKATMFPGLDSICEELSNRYF